MGLQSCKFVADNKVVMTWHVGNPGKTIAPLTWIFRLLIFASLSCLPISYSPADWSSNILTYSKTSPSIISLGLSACMITAPGTLFFFLPYDSIAHLFECNLLFSLAERMLIVSVLIGFGIKSRQKAVETPLPQHRRDDGHTG